MSIFFIRVCCLVCIVFHPRIAFSRSSLTSVPFPVFELDIFCYETQIEFIRCNYVSEMSLNKKWCSVQIKLNSVFHWLCRQSLLFGYTCYTVGEVCITWMYLMEIEISLILVPFYHFTLYSVCLLSFQYTKCVIRVKCIMERFI